MNLRPFALLLALVALSASAQPYPTKPVKIVASSLPGGGVDLVARTVAEQLQRALQQSFVVENNAGGGGSIASQSVARAAPDGYTLMVGYVATHGTNPAVRKVPYDPVKDFTAIAMVGGTPNVLVVNASFPASDLKGLLDYMKKNPTRVSTATGGIGTLTHLILEQLKGAGGLDVVTVHYRSIAPAFTELIAGQVNVLMPGLAAGLPHIRGKKIRPIAVTGVKRHPLLPDVPTFEESGFAGFDGLQWYGIVGPARLPADITARLNAEINKSLASPALRERLSAEALEPMPMSPEQFGAFIQTELARWSKLARERNISLDD